MAEKKGTILVVDDEPQIRKLLEIYLEAADLKCEPCENGKQAVRLASSLKPDIILLDLGLPDIDGKEVIQAIRTWSQTPIIVVSVRDDDAEIAHALDLGADDYMVKPFSAEVLLARIRANLRKAAVREAGDSIIKNGHLVIDLVKHEVHCNEERVTLTPKEFDLLRYLVVNRGKMLTHRQILKEIWGPAYVDNTQYLRVYVRQLRDKLNDNNEQPLIKTAQGIGYRMEVLEEVPTEAA